MATDGTEKTYPEGTEGAVGQGRDKFMHSMCHVDAQPSALRVSRN